MLDAVDELDAADELPPDEADDVSGLGPVGEEGPVGVLETFEDAGPFDDTVGFVEATPYEPLPSGDEVDVLFDSSDSIDQDSQPDAVQ